jgi:hypothetical protein
MGTIGSWLIVAKVPPKSIFLPMFTREKAVESGACTFRSCARLIGEKVDCRGNEREDVDCCTRTAPRR